MHDRLVVLFDDDCGFCRWSVARLRTLDRHRRLRFASIQGPYGASLLAGIAPEARLRSMHVVGPDGCVTSSGPALVRVAGELPAGRSLAWFGRTFPGAAERAYRAVASRRHMLGRLVGADACSADRAPAGA